MPKWQITVKWQSIHLKSTSFHVYSSYSHNCAGHCGGNTFRVQFVFCKAPIAEFSKGKELGTIDTGF